MENTLDLVLKGLMKRYMERVPAVKKLLGLMQVEKLISSVDELENDHIAFRTLGVPHLGVGSLEKIFIHYGYVKKDHYYFKEKKLDAWWYAPPQEKYPRIFISELRVNDLLTGTGSIIHRYTETVSSDPVDALDLDNALVVDRFLHSGLWPIPSFTDYQDLLQASEYAAWVIYNRYYLNHFTIAVHNLKPGYDTIESFNRFLEANGFVLNDAGGKIKTSPDGGLLQSSTVAEKVMAPFSNGDIHAISGSYVEFAERRVLPAFSDIPKNQLRREHRREGFEAGNADKIFESTYSGQVERTQ